MTTIQACSKAIDEFRQAGYERALDLAPEVAEKVTEAAVWASRVRNRRRIRIGIAAIGMLAVTVVTIRWMRRRRDRASETTDITHDRDEHLTTVAERTEDVA